MSILSCLLAIRKSENIWKWFCFRWKRAGGDRWQRRKLNYPKTETKLRTDLCGFSNQSAHWNRFSNHGNWIQRRSKAKDACRSSDWPVGLSPKSVNPFLERMKVRPHLNTGFTIIFKETPADYAHAVKNWIFTPAWLTHSNFFYPENPLWEREERARKFCLKKNIFSFSVSSAVRLSGPLSRRKIAAIRKSSQSNANCTVLK